MCDCLAFFFTVDNAFPIYQKFKSALTVKKIIIGSLVVIFAIGAYIAYRVLSSRSLSPSQTITYNYKGLDIKLVYCRPFKKGRQIFGDAKDALVPNGKYWRLGANKATEITFSKDIRFGGKPVKAGSYRMYAVPNESSWSISLNSELGKWGFDEPDYSLDVLKAQVPAEATQTETEQFTISFGNDSTGLKMYLDWDKKHLLVPIEVE